MPRNTVALGVRVPVPDQSSNALSNPIQAMEGIARIQNMRNQNLLFQQQYAARIRQGEIMSQAPSIEEGFNQIMRDPIAGPFAGESFRDYKQGMQAQREINASLYKDSSTALESVYKAMPQAFIDPDGFKVTMAANFAALPKDAQDASRNSFNYVMSGLFGGLEAFPKDQQAAELQKRVTGFALAGNYSPDNIRNINGYPAPSFQKDIVGPQGQPMPGTVVAPLGGGSYFEPLTMGPGGGSPTAGVAPGGGRSVAPVEPPGAPPGPPPAGAEEAPAGTKPPEPQLVTPPAPGGVVQGQPITGPTTRDTELYKVGPEQLKEVNEDMSADARTIPVLANRMNTLVDALKEFPAGGWASGRERLASFIQGLGHAMGVDTEKVDQWTQGIVGGKIEAQQVFKSLISLYGVEQLKEVAKGTGRVMKPEVDAALNNIDVNADPRAIIGYLNSTGYNVLQIGADRVNKFAQYKKDSQAGKLGPYGPEDFYLWHANTMDRKNLPTTIGGFNIAPRDIGEAKGVPQQAPRGYYNPATGFSPNPTGVSSP